MTARRKDATTVRAGYNRGSPASARTPRHLLMQYEALYWSMACIVATALLGGAVCARASSLRGSLAGTLALSAAAGCVAYGLASAGAFTDYAPILGVASFMFCMMISSAAALVTRRLLRRP